VRRILQRRLSFFETTILETKMKTYLSLAVAVLGCIAANSARADVGMGLRAGTQGYGGDIDIALMEKLNVRVGYNMFNTNREIEDTDVVYDGEIKLSNASVLLDWHPFASGFRLSVGGVGPGLTADVQGRSTGGTYEIGDGVYSAAQIGSLNGTLKFGNSVAPYVGLGWGNAVGKNHRVTFLFDLGAAYVGKSTVDLSATCGPSLSQVQCATVQTRLRTDLAAEQQEMRDSVGAVQWWPVISLGLGIRF
jgi:hypothetical protein